MTGAVRFPMAELVHRSETPPASIHHYLRKGLLPSPKRVAANRFLYDERHVRRLRLIRELRRRRRLPLTTIRRILPELLAAEEQEAFRPEMWDRVAEPHVGRTAPGRILRAAVEAFTRKGYEAVGVDDICRQARIAKGSFYRHFASKEEVFLAAAEAVGSEAAEALAGGGRHDDVSRLAAALEPRLPLVLEVLSGAARGEPRLGAAARAMVERLASALGGSLDAAAATLERAVGSLVRGLGVASDATRAFPA